jgi:hypothetical protein
MMIRTAALAALAVFVLAAQASGHPATPGTDTVGAKVFALSAQNGSGESGTVALQPFGQKTEVEIHLLGAPKDVAQPAHIHVGTCSKLNPAPKYPLSSVHDGFSETLIDVPLATLTATPLAVNVHKSAADLKTYVACGNL